MRVCASRRQFFFYDVGNNVGNFFFITWEDQDESVCKSEEFSQKSVHSDVLREEILERDS